MRRRLPAEVITRKRKEVRQVEEKVAEDVRVDLKTAISLKPDSRPKWLAKAFKMVEDGKAPSSELYAIITSRKFIGGLPGKIGRRLHEIVMEGIDSFSEKQRRFLNSEDWALQAQYADKPAEATKDDDAGDDPPSPPEKEEPEKKAAGKEGKDNAEETWVTAPAARIHQERNARETQLAEERAKRKEKEREEQERWMEAQAEASQKKAKEQQEAKRRQLEDEVDNSLSLLGDLSSPPPGNSSSAKDKKRKDRDRDRDRDRDDKESRGRKGRDGLSRSRSVKARSRSRRRKRSKSRGRRRDRSGSRPKVDFNEALRRRLQEREASDTTRMAVVDPGHAQRWSSRG